MPRRLMTDIIDEVSERISSAPALVNGLRYVAVNANRQPLRHHLFP